MKHIATLSVIVCLISVSTGLFGAPVEDPMKTWYGEWKATTFNFQGLDMLAGSPESAPRIRLAADTLTFFHQNDRVVVCDYKVDLSKTPPWFDYEVREGPFKGQRTIGLVSVEGDEMKLCLTTVRPGVRVERPETFKMPVHPEQKTLFIARRVQPQPK